MKQFLAFFFLLVTCQVSGQQGQNALSRSVSDDGKQLKVRVKGHINGERVDYNRTFEVSGYSKVQKEALQNRILDSLGVQGQAKAPAQPRPPVPRNQTASAQPLLRHDSDYTRDVSYDRKTGVLVMKYRFVKGGVEYNAERTVDTGTDSSDKRERLVREFEKEIGLPGAM